MIRLWCAFLSLFLFVQSAHANRSAVVVIMGGQDSCKHTAPPWRPGAFIPRVQEMVVTPGAGNDAVQAIRDATGTQIRVVYTCYNYWGQLYYQSQRHPEVRNTSWSNLTPFYQALMEEAGEEPIFMLGHSHGAWTATLTSLELPEGKIDSLFTLDMISRKNCGVREVIRGFFNERLTWATGGRYLPRIGHNVQTPVEFDAEQRALLHARLQGTWHNYYQVEHMYLHSTPIEGPHAPHCQSLLSIAGGVMQGPSDFFRYRDAHDRMKVDPSIWKSFSDLVIARLSSAV